MLFWLLSVCRSRIGRKRILILVRGGGDAVVAEPRLLGVARLHAQAQVVEPSPAHRAVALHPGNVAGSEATRRVLAGSSRSIESSMPGAPAAATTGGGAMSIRSVARSIQARVLSLVRANCKSAVLSCLLASLLALQA